MCLPHLNLLRQIRYAEEIRSVLHDRISSICFFWHSRIWHSTDGELALFANAKTVLIVSRMGWQDIGDGAG